MTSSDGLAHLWMAQLAACAGMAAVAALRRTCRRWLGAERAFLLWLLPPFALLASQWPHSTSAAIFALPDAVRRVAAGPVVAAATRSGENEAHVALLWGWAVGVVIILLAACLAQRAYTRQLRHATRYVMPDGRWPVIRAISSSVGPSMVGAWRPVIVLPGDFEQRYTTHERELVLAHEVAHAERRDGWWALCALVFTACCWPGLVAWWALRAFRMDQELACDARVLRRFAGRRRSYALAMLKTPQATFALPTGCSWSSRHPLSERIAMLNLPLPGPLVRRAGFVAMLGACAAISGFVYAATAPASTARSLPATVANEYQLDMAVDVVGDDGSRRHADKASLALCMKPGEKGSVSVHVWSLDATAVPDQEGHVRMALDLKDGAGASLARPELRGTLDSASHVEGMALDGKHRYAIDITPRAGCPAREKARIAQAG